MLIKDRKPILQDFQILKFFIKEELQILFLPKLLIDLSFSFYFQILSYSQMSVNLVNKNLVNQ